MWSLNNSTRYRADRAWVRDVDGRENWLVAVRARYLINDDGSLDLANDENQMDVRVAPEISGEGLKMLLTADTDLPYAKLATDVLVQGNACAPSSKPVERLRVRIRVATIDKELMVFGDRAWIGNHLDRPQPFLTMPLTYRKAFGGPNLADLRENRGPHWYEENPAGVGYSSSPEALDGSLAPNIEYPGTLISSTRDRPPPAGFGPIMAHWPQRRRYTGTYDRTWEEQRLPLLPVDFNMRFYQTAPEDQQCNGFLNGGEYVILEGLTPSGILKFNLPQVSLAFESHFDDLTRVKHSAHLHTVIFEPDWPAVSVVWHTRLECHQRVMQLRETQIWERGRVRSSTT